MKYLNLNSEYVERTMELASNILHDKYVPNPKKCKKGHQYVNNECINCGRKLGNIVK